MAEMKLAPEVGIYNSTHLIDEVRQCPHPSVVHFLEGEAGVQINKEPICWQVTNTNLGHDISCWAIPTETAMQIPHRLMGKKFANCASIYLTRCITASETDECTICVLNH